ncbi:MAG TPA: aspartyl protease family protein [Vicinamibacterales bacterium]|nr:aspartyl protease family protein [Vicinamibacterales bacterium]
MLLFLASLAFALGFAQTATPPATQGPPPPAAQTTAPKPPEQTAAPKPPEQTAAPKPGEPTAPKPAEATAAPKSQQAAAPQPAVVSRARRLAEPEAAGPIVLPMELVAGRPVIRLMVNGKGPYAFLVSTGAQTTVIDEKLASELALKPPSEKEKEKAGEKPNEKEKERDKKAPAMLELDLEAGTTKLPKVQVLATDLTKYVADAGLAGLSRGVLSLWAWKDHLVTISFPPRWKVTIEPGTLPEANGQDIFPLDPETGELRLSVTIADQSIPCRVEPLAPGGLVMPESFLKQMLLDGPPIELGTMAVAGQSLTVREARLAYSAVLAGFELSKPVVRFAGAGDSATAGSHSLTGLSITYDLKNNRARLVKQPPQTPR